MTDRDPTLTLILSQTSVYVLDSRLRGNDNFMLLCAPEGHEGSLATDL